MCVLILLSVCPRTAMCVRILLSVSSECHMCVLILLQGDIMDLNTLTKCILQRAIQVLTNLNICAATN